VISTPPTGECQTGQRGAPSRLNGVPCRTSGQQSLPEAILYTTSPDSFDPAGLAQFETLSENVAMRRFEGNCYAYGLLALGHVDLLVEMNLHPYNYTALVQVPHQSKPLLPFIPPQSSDDSPPFVNLDQPASCVGFRASEIERN